MIRWFKKRWMFLRRIPFILARKYVKSGRILIIQTCALGDAAILVPFVKKIIDTGLKVTVAAKPGRAEFWSIVLPGIEVINLDYNHLPQPEVDKFCKRFEREQYEAVFAVSIMPEPAMVASFCSARNCFGLIEDSHYYRGSLISFRKRYNAGKNEHVHSRFAHLFNLYFKDIDFTDLEKPGAVLSCSEGSKVLIHPGAKWKPRRWPKEKFLELARALEGKGCDVRIIHGAEDPDLGEYFSREIGPGRVSSPAGMKELLDEIKSRDVFIGNDSGPAHLANLFGKRTVVLWGPGNDKRIAPLGPNVSVVMRDVPCRPCRQYRSGDTCEKGDNICLKQIEVRDVIDILNI